MSYEVIDSEKIYEGKILNLRKDTITLPDGKNTIREIVEHNGASAMLAFDNKGKILLVRQYRHSAGMMTLELPAGTIEKDENAYECAVREIEEETGYKCYNMKLMFEMYSAIGFCTEKIHVFLCHDLIESESDQDDDEFITVEHHSLEKCLDLIKEGKICDSKTIAAICAYRSLISEY